MPNEVVLDKEAIARFGKSPEVVAMLESSDLLREIVAEIRRRAPEVIREGADSIDFELDESGEFYRISWGEKYFYVWFFEVGTFEIRATPFIRPVVDRLNNS